MVNLMNLNLGKKLFVKIDKENKMMYLLLLCKFVFMFFKGNYLIIDFNKLLLCFG